MKLYLPFSLLLAGVSLAPGQQAPVQFADAEFSKGRGETPRVLVIAHRGGVVGPDSPECSAEALLKAIEEGYDGVELDLQSSADGTPFVFHDATLDRATVGRGPLRSLASDTLRETFFKGTESALMPLDMAVELAAGKLVLMLEIKGTGHSEYFYRNILDYLEEAGITPYTFVFPNNAETRQWFEGKLRLQLNPADIPGRMAELEAQRGRHFVFGLPADLRKLPVAELRSKGVPVIAAINTFRYPKAGHREAARKDIAAMVELGVDGFQIDSEYLEILRSLVK